jgi:membrane-bound lytic murein transglycosylase D
VRRLRATHPEKPRTALFLPFLALALLLAGCSGVRTGPTVTPEQPPVPAAAQPAAPPEKAADEAILSARAHQAAAERALLNGENALARQEFEAGLRVLQEGGADPRLEEVSTEIADEIKALDVLAAGGGEQAEPGSEGEPAEEVEPSPLDELATATPELSPGEIEAERGLIDYAGLKFDIPFVVNDRVISWVDFYTNRYRDKFVPGLIRSGRFLPMIQRIFEEEGLPKDLAYMAHVESAFKTNAYSRAKAKGIFQFIAGTGRRYGLRTDSWVDERSDPEKATRAAAAYLKDLYGMFGDWYLALAAYNAGEGKIQRVVDRTGKHDFWSLASSGVLRNETVNYVPAILAATLISKDPGRFGFEFEPEPPIEYDNIQVEGSVNLRVLARCAGTDFETMQQLNPALRRRQTPAGTTEVRVPPGTGDMTLSALADVPQSERGIAARHVVAKGETLAGIAKLYGVPSSAIRKANGMGKRGVRAGESLIVPGGTAEATDVAGRRKTSRSGGTAVYRVRRGDTLSSIARQYGTTPSAIASANGIPLHGVLNVGRRLSIPGRGASASNAQPVKSGRSAADGSRVVHTVRRGETLFGIAERYQITVDRLCALNDITPDATIYPGLRLTIQ